jgi:DNA replication and repair protein RecF
MRRRELVGLMELEMASHARDVGSPFDYAMRYESALFGHATEGDEITLEASLTRAFHEKLGAAASEESRRGITLVGPHRDDVVLTMGGEDLRRYGSQGQRRLCAVLLKLAELSYLETELEEPSVLLLDDVFSEFDASILAKLQRMLDGERQVFITSPVAIHDLHAPNARLFRVESGRVLAT